MKTRVKGQFARYVIVGLISNFVIFIVYLCLTALGLSPKIAMSFLYFVGVAQTFFFNKKWSFQFTGPLGPSLVRYLIVYFLGYTINIIALIILVDRIGFSHQIVQGLMILLIAMFLFIAKKMWVFPQPLNKETA